NFHSSSNEFCVVLATDFVLQSEQLIVPSFLDLLRNIIFVESKGFCAGARAVFEDEAVLEAKLTHSIQTLLESRFCLLTEADDEIAGDGAIGEILPDTSHHFTIVCDGITPFHQLELLIASML